MIVETNSQMIVSFFFFKKFCWDQNRRFKLINFFYMNRIEIDDSKIENFDLDLGRKRSKPSKEGLVSI